MRKVAVFGNTGGGKSTLARRFAELTKLPLYVVELMQFGPGGARLPQEEFLRAHADLLQRDNWIIDGYGSTALSWERFAAADTPIYIDLPLSTHHRWVTKRLIKGLFSDPPGCPEHSPLWSSSIQSYRVLWLCHRHLTPRYRRLVTETAASKRVHDLRSSAQIQSFLENVKNEFTVMNS
jgi:adenylate kinase family enzyme